MAEQEGPKGPKNKTGRPWGSGTTNEARKAKRAHKQWSALEQADPSSPSHLVSHLEALEKAQKRWQQRLQEELQKAMEGAVPGGCKHRGKSGQPRKAQLTPRQDLEKSTSKALKKAKEEPASSSTGPAPMDLEKSNAKDLEKSKAKDLGKSKAKPKAKAKASQSKDLESPRQWV